MNWIKITGIADFIAPGPILLSHGDGSFYSLHFINYKTGECEVIPLTNPFVKTIKAVYREFTHIMIIETPT